MLTVPLFILFGAMAVGCAVAMVAQRNPLYSAISLIGVFVSLACLYLTLQAPFIAAVQVIVYAGAIMVLVVFVIMLLNVEEEVRRPVRLHFLIPVSVVFAAVLVAEAAFMLKLGGAAHVEPVAPQASGVGLTASIGTGLFTDYLLPFEVTSVPILMALVGAVDNRRGRRNHQAQRHRDVYVHRADAQRREPDLRRVFELLRRRDGPALRLHRDDGRRSRGRRRTRNHHRNLSQPRVARR